MYQFHLSIIIKIDFISLEIAEMGKVKFNDKKLDENAEY